MKDLTLTIAQHEAAHVVVGVACGLWFKGASIVPTKRYAGWANFPWGARWRQALCSAAGPAINRRIGAPRWADRGDLDILRNDGFDRRQIEALIKLAWKILRTRRRAHTAVTRALLDRGRITGADINDLVKKIGFGLDSQGAPGYE